MEQNEWLDLTYFDDSSFDDNANEDWIERTRDEENQMHKLTGRGTYEDKESKLIRFKSVIVEKYDRDSDKYIGYYKSNKQETFRLHRLYICFDAEDPRKYVLRVANAFQQRVYADSIIRYNFYIDNMAQEDLAELDSEQKKRIEQLATGAPYWKGVGKTNRLDEIGDAGNLTQEANKDFCRTMNKIIFDQFLEE